MNPKNEEIKCKDQETCKGADTKILRFPDNFMIGAATAAYQIEGAWNKDGKGESIWDHLVHNHPEKIKNQDTGDIAANSYYQYKEDVKILKDMGMEFYRFSISWPRILPQGDISTINEKGIEYYDNLINELIAKNILPVVTIYHWDLPQELQNIGGWTNILIADYYEDFARLCFQLFGEKVKWWITINEPAQICMGYGSPIMAPGYNMTGVADYLAGHTVLLAHAKAYHAYNSEFRDKQQGKIGIAISSHWFEPKTDLPEDKEAAERSLQFVFGWFAHPIFSEEGDYPPIMREMIDKHSLTEGRSRSRLPYFTAETRNFVKGTSDFLGINNYTSFLVSNGLTQRTLLPNPDAKVTLSQDSLWPSSSSIWLRMEPSGFRKLINWVTKQYNNPPIFITENGFSDYGEINDTTRVKYFTSYLSELLKAIYEDKCNVFGYAAWSLIDNFEWNSGYSEKFGLYHVDFNHPERKRTPKQSSYVLKTIIKNRRLQD